MNINIYFAGLFDGEGCISINHTKRKNRQDTYDLRCTVNMTDPAPILKLKEIYGGSFFIELPKKRGHHTSRFSLYRWNVGGELGENFIKSILPYCLNKRPQLELGLKFRQTIQDRNYRLTKEELETRAKYKKEMAALKLIKVS